MSTQIFVKETTYGSFTVEKDINQENYEENFDYIIDVYQNQDQTPFETRTQFSLNLNELDQLQSNIHLDKNSIKNNSVTITDGENGTLKSIRLHKNEYNIVELHILDKKGNVEKNHHFKLKNCRNLLKNMI